MLNKEIQYNTCHLSFLFCIAIKDMAKTNN